MRIAIARAAATASLPHGGVLASRSRRRRRAHRAPHAPSVALSPTRTPASVWPGVTTWYFTSAKFTQPGLAIELRSERVSAVYTVWQPRGWHSITGVRIGAVEGQVTKLAAPVTPVVCPAYTALVRDGSGVRTAYYIVDGKLWGFGLMSARSPCR